MISCFEISRRFSGTDGCSLKSSFVRVCALSNNDLDKRTLQSQDYKRREKKSTRPEYDRLRAQPPCSSCFRGRMQKDVNVDSRGVNQQFNRSLASPFASAQMTPANSPPNCKTANYLSQTKPTPSRQSTRQSPSGHVSNSGQSTSHSYVAPVPTGRFRLSSQW